MSEFAPDDYEDKLKHLEQRHEILAAWIVMVFFALLFVALELSLVGAHHVVWHRHAFAPDIAFIDPSDRIDWSDENGDGHAVTIIDREETRQGRPGLNDTQ